MLRRFGQRIGLGLFERGFGGRIKTAGIFPLWPERECEEFGGHFVVLAVGLVRMGGDGETVHGFHEEVFRIRGRRRELALGSTAKKIDAGERHGVGERGALGSIDGEGQHVHCDSPE